MAIDQEPACCERRTKRPTVRQTVPGRGFYCARLPRVGQRSAHILAAISSASTCGVPAFTRMMPRDWSGNVTSRMVVPRGLGEDSSDMAHPIC